ncbi:MAG TPA: hypothetical protein VGH28_33715 [Polyangiaceae bacterium]|jgi:Flp pilus assembly protein TadB
MSDAEKPTDELRAKAAFALAKHAAERALADPAEQDALSKRKRNKRIAQIAIGALVVVGLLGLMLHYWYWSLLLGFVGVAGLYVRRRWRARRASRKKIEVTAPREAPALKVRIEPEPAPVEDADASIDDDLAELKARLKR